MENGFEIGKECVSIKDGVLKHNVNRVLVERQLVFKRNTIFTIVDIKRCKCGDLVLDVNLGDIASFNMLKMGKLELMCSKCHNVFFTNRGPLYWIAKDFAPLQYDNAAIENLLKQPIEICL